MKKAIYITSILLLALASCVVLDINSQDSIIADEAFKNKLVVKKGIIVA